jgi:hypothetical protein
MKLLGLIALLGACSTEPTAVRSATSAARFDHSASGAATRVVVSPESMNGWYFWNDKNDTFAGSPGELVSGPATPPLGVGSVRLGPLTDNGETGSGHAAIATDAYLERDSLTSRRCRIPRISPVQHSPSRCNSIFGITHPTRITTGVWCSSRTRI